jgi:hypothetical protein
MPPRSKAAGLVIGGRTPSPESVRELAGSKADLYYFQSPKNHCRFVFCNQLAFYLAILLEAELNVTSYLPTAPDDPGPESKSCLTAIHYGGESLSYFACYEHEAKSEVIADSLSDLGAPQADGLHTIVTAQFIRDQHVQIENWLTLCATMNRARDCSCLDESEFIYRELRRSGITNLGTLIDGAGIDEARMLAAVGRGLQSGTLICDTATEPLTYGSALALRRGVS